MIKSKSTLLLMKNEHQSVKPSPNDAGKLEGILWMACFPVLNKHIAFQQSKLKQLLLGPKPRQVLD